MSSAPVGQHERRQRKFLNTASFGIGERKLWNDAPKKTEGPGPAWIKLPSTLANNTVTMGHGDRTSLTPSCDLFPIFGEGGVDITLLTTGC